MMVTGKEDYRTPSSEAEQFYGALKIRKVPTAMLRTPPRVARALLRSLLPVDVRETAPAVGGARRKRLAQDPREQSDRYSSRGSRRKGSPHAAGSGLGRRRDPGGRPRKMGGIPSRLR